MGALPDYEWLDAQAWIFETASMIWLIARWSDRRTD